MSSDEKVKANINQEKNRAYCVQLAIYFIFILWKF